VSKLNHWVEVELTWLSLAFGDEPLGAVRDDRGTPSRVSPSVAVPRTGRPSSDQSNL